MPDSQPRRGPKTPGGRTGALISWAVIVLIAVLLGLAQAGVFSGSERAEEVAEAAETAGAVEGDPAIGPDAETGAEAPSGAAAPGEPTEAPASAMFEVVARSVVGSPSDSREQSMRSIDLVAQKETDQLRLAVLMGYVKGEAEAVKRLDALSQQKDLNETLKRDIDTLRLLYADGESSIEANAAARMAARHGWFWQVAQASTTSEESEQRLRLEEDAKVTYWIASGCSLLLLIMLVLSFGLFVTGIVLVATGKVQRTYIPPAPGGSAYIEMFALFLVAFTGLSLAMGLAAAYGSPGVQAFADTAMHVLRWALLGAAAWPLTRGAAWREVRAAIGWTTPKGFFREVGSGVVGYLACLPIIAVGVAITLAAVALAGLLAGEDAAMPTHPLPEMLAQAAPIQVVLLVILATVWAPIVEESFFRGALYHHLRGRLHWVLAGLASGLIFAAIHPQGVLAIPALMSIALVLSMLREWRGSLIASMTAHAVNNGVITLSVILLMKVQ